MGSIPTRSTGSGQRSLAAIVFTDVVGFSARMQSNEETTLRLLQRDFGAMRDLCAQHHGAVLKTTGDGLLLHFSSAVQAVACALAMQRFFADQAKIRPAAECLVHRLGIHLGDVFVNDQDVMGDGVNIAARLQAEAEPGGICISQTVYDVVKNKLALSATRLGPRELKNISQAIPIYKLLLEAQTLGAGEPEAQPEGCDRPRRAFTLGKYQKMTMATALVLLLGLLAVFAARTWLQRQEEQARAEAAQAALQALLAENAADKAAQAKAIRILAEWRDELRDKRSRAAEEYNFAELERSLREPHGPTINPEDLKIRAQMLQRMKALFGWLGVAMQRYSREKPLVVRELAGTAPKEIKVYAGPDRQLYYAEGGAIRQRNWAELKPAALGAIIAGAMLDAPIVPHREIILGAETFALFYQLPELSAALGRNRPKRPIH